MKKCLSVFWDIYANMIRGRSSLNLVALSAMILLGIIFVWSEYCIGGLVAASKCFVFWFVGGPCVIYFIDRRTGRIQNK